MSPVQKIINEIATVSYESRKEWLLRMFSEYAKSRKNYTYYQLWQHRNHAITLDTNHLIDQKLQYILLNPVDAGIVTEPEHYIFSSACPLQRVKLNRL